MVPKGGQRLSQLPRLEKTLRDVCDEWINKATSDTRALPIKKIQNNGKGN
jgi:hypothetical protein